MKNGQQTTQIHEITETPASDAPSVDLRPRNTKILRLRPIKHNVSRDPTPDENT